MGPTPHDLLTTLLVYDDARGTPVSNATHSGYQRLEAGGTVLIMDTGSPPPIALSRDAHAGCLAFELSTRYHRIIVNCGLPAVNRENWRQVARATAAHSTATLNDTSSCRFADTRSVKRMFGGIPVMSGPKKVPVTRTEGVDGVGLRAAHDGYADAFGIMHERIVTISADGQRVAGEDSFTASSGDELPKRAPDAFALRFHLHPAIKANRLGDGHGVMLLLPSKDVWTFHVPDHTVELDESVYLAGADGPRRSLQIVINAHARSSSRVRWLLSQVPPQLETAQRRAPQEEPPRLPL
jgi:uncharacterized heparinase superfamily protein